ncbi:MAG: hypothetical protein HGA45_31755 [Chloroflexales bacterium]|nr:hypothetical protein [Chloroflexales bacterium]
MKLEFSIPFEEQPEQPLDLAAYSFDRYGRLIDRATVKEGRTTLEFGDWEGAQPRLLIAPVLAEERQPTLAELRKRGAYEPVWAYNPRQKLQELLPIPAQIAGRWLLCFCRVRGQVVRPIRLLGLTLEIPVCHARVHICEVDRLPILIARLPDEIIFRLRDELLPLLERPFVPPIPRPDPPPERVQIADILQDALGGQVFEQVAAPRSALLSHAEVQLNPQPLPPKERAAIELPLELRIGLGAPAAQIVRATLIDNVQLIWPLLCLWPWFWPWLTCEEIRVLETDDQGRFDTFITYPCRGDKPDLYFWVEYLINGVWTTVYRPPLHCNVYWNYACGSEVTIRVSDSRVGCRPRPLGPLVSVYGIGTQVAVESIDGDGYAPGISINSVTVPRRPFGGLLGLWADFASDPLAAAGVSHYLWSYRPAGISADPDLGWLPLTTPFGRRYRADFPPANSVSKLYQFEVDSANGKFRIPPEQPWLADGASGGAWDDWTLNGFATALFDTTALPSTATTDAEGNPISDKSGDYELKLELFRADGSRVNLSDAGIDIQVQNMATAAWDDWHNIGLVNRYVVGGSLMGFTTTLHIDNNPLVGEILEVEVGAAAAGPCGFIEYPASASATVAFRAGHHHNHAAFYFALSRGSSGRIEVAQAMAGTAIVDPVDPATSVVIDPVNRYNLGAYTYTRHAPVSQLLGPGCDQAALAEELYVYATATDGWNGRLYWLDVYAPVKAFALTPEA